MPHRKKFWFFSFLLFLIVLLSALWYWQSYRDRYKDSLEMQLQTRTNAYAYFLEAMVNTIGENLVDIGLLLADVESVDAEEEERINRVLSSMAEHLVLIDFAYYALAEQEKVIHSGGSQTYAEVGLDLRKRSWYRQAVDVPRFHLEDIYIDFNTGKRVMTLSSAVRREGTVLGVLAADIFLDNLFETLSPTIADREIAYMIVDRQGHFLYHRDPLLLGTSAREVENPETIDQLFRKTLEDHLPYRRSGERLFTIEYGLSIPGTPWVILARPVKSFHESALRVAAYQLIVITLAGFALGEGMLYAFFFFVVDRDRLTGLKRKKTLKRLLKKRLAAGEEQRLIFIDIFDFSLLNRRMGRAFGDQVIQGAAKDLEDLLGGEGVLVYAGADGFFFLPDHHDYGLFEKDMEQLFAPLERRLIFVEGEGIVLNFFTGIVKLSKMALSYDDFMVRIEESFVILMKRANQSLVVLNSFEQLIAIKEEEEREREALLTIIDSGAVAPYFQPIVSLDTETVVRYEVLMRVLRDGQVDAPYPTIRTAEKWKVIDRLDLLVIEKALDHKCAVDPEDTLCLSFNLSGLEMRDNGYLDKVMALIDDRKINRSHINFELTETEALGEIGLMAERMTHYRILGFTFSIDDFGTGFSSVQYLKTLPVSHVKIDGIFIENLAKSEKNRYLVQAMSNMAKAFEMKIIAEYVEDASTVEVLRSFGIDEAQGYHYGKPVDRLPTVPNRQKM